MLIQKAGFSAALECHDPPYQAQLTLWGGLRAWGLGFDAPGWLTGHSGASDPCPWCDEFCQVLSPPFVSILPFPSSPHLLFPCPGESRRGIAGQVGGGLSMPIVVVVVTSTPKRGRICVVVADLGFGLDTLLPHRQDCSRGAAVGCRGAVPLGLDSWLSSRLARHDG